MHKIKIFLIIITIYGSIMAQNFNFEVSLYYNHGYFKEKSLKNRFFKHSEILNLIERLNKSSVFRVQKLGYSFERKEIFLLNIGQGNKKIFFWSQMHGDEPTATAALFDIFNFLNDTIHYPDVRNLILKNCSLYFIPMLNPDGADNFSRRNSMMIDINRDALRLESPEAKILMKVFEEIKPDFAFNLHDQSHRFSVGNSFRQSAMAFLAPAFDYDKTIDSTRLNSIKLISSLFEMLNNFIPGHISRYSDEYEPRAFGDNFQKRGTSTILVESCGWKNDPEKQFIRKLNFITLISAIKQIAEESYKNFNDEDYNSIPLNEEKLYDLILRNLTISKKGYEYKVDLAINYEEVLNRSKTGTFKKAKIENIGDLSTFFGIEDYDLSGYRIDSGKTMLREFDNLKELKKENYIEIFKKGYTNVFVDNVRGEISDVPFNILTNKRKPDFSIQIGNNPTFLIKKNGKIEYSIINGFIQNHNTKTFHNNGLIF
jgi:hypothetical protein